MSIFGKPILTGVGRGSASGAVASFSDGAKGLPLRSLVANINPVQDLHGYDNPWPAGGGKNKIPYPYYTADGTVSGVAFSTASDGKITAAGTTDAGLNYFLARDMTLNAGTYTVSVSGTHTALTLIARDPVNNVILGDVAPTETSATFTISETTSVRLYFNTSIVGASVDISAYVQLESGNQPTAYSTYSNICPISGWSECKVWRTGKNLSSLNVCANNPTFFWGGDYIELKAILNTLPAGTYVLSNKYKIVTLPVSGSVIHGKFLIRDVDGNNMASYSVVTDNSPTVGKVYEEVTTFTITDALVGKIGKCYYYCDSSDHSATPASNRGTYNLYDIQLELGSTATPYEPYSGNQYTIQLGQTVYGGTLDVTNGVLTVDRAMKVFNGASSEGWAKDSGYNYFITPTIRDAINRNALPSDFQSNLFPYGAITNGSSVLGACLIWGAVRVRLADMSISLEDWKAQLASTPMQVVYTLATPIIIPLTPTQISTLAGQNVLWADSGDVNVEYLKQTLKYIGSYIH